MCFCWWSAVAAALIAFSPVVQAQATAARRLVPGRQPASRHSSTQPAPTPNLDSVPAYVTASKAAGFDFLKVHNETPAMLVAVLAAGRQVGIPVVGHVPNEEGALDQALAGGMRSVEHLTGYLYQPPPSKMIIALKNAGAGLLLGSDQPNVGTDIHKEFEDLVEIGLTPFEALTMGTKNMAFYLDQLDESGTIAAGKRADLVLLNDNPLQDVRNTQRLAEVMIGGRWLDRDQLDCRLAGVDRAQDRG